MNGSANNPIAVTGAGGFIGSHLVARMRAEGCAVRAIYGPDDRVTQLSTSDSVCDILDRDSLRVAITGCKIIVHLAGPPSVAASFRQPSKAATVHTGGTATLLEVAQHAGIDRFVYCSSAEVYGQPITNPVAETSVMNPLSPYGAAKAAAEWIVRAAATTAGFEAFILRPFTVYGPSFGRHSLLHLIIDKANNDDAIKLMNLAPVRDYVFVADAVDAICKACFAASPDTVNVCNVGSGLGHSVRELAETVLRVVGRSLPVCETGERDRPAELDIVQLVANIERSTSLLGWSPQTSLEDGIRFIIDQEERRIAA